MTCKPRHRAAQEAAFQEIPGPLTGVTGYLLDAVRGFESIANYDFCPDSGFFRLAERSQKADVLPSINSRRTMKNKSFQRSFNGDCAVSSVVEHFLDTEGVTGSNPVSRTIFYSL